MKMTKRGRPKRIPTQWTLPREVLVRVLLVGLPQKKNLNLDI
jgi:hypothetical protein